MDKYKITRRNNNPLHDKSENLGYEAIPTADILSNETAQKNKNEGIMLTDSSRFSPNLQIKRIYLKIGFIFLFELLCILEYLTSSPLSMYLAFVELTTLLLILGDECMNMKKESQDLIDVTTTILCLIMLVLQYLYDKELVLYGFLFSRIWMKTMTLIYLFSQIRQNSMLFKRRYSTDRYAPIQKRLNYKYEKVLFLLQKVKDFCDNKGLSDDINWCVDAIEDKKLYEPLHISIGRASIMAKACNENEKYAMVCEIALSVGEKALNGRVSASPVNIPEEVSTEIANIHTLKFNIFNLKTALDNEELYFLMIYFFKKYNYEAVLGINTQQYANYCKVLKQSYRAENSYHNPTHAADVLYYTNLFLMKHKMQEKCMLTDIEFFSSLFSAAVHDVDHPGNNNIFEINTNSKLAMLYNDKSVLENHHLAIAFKLASVKGFQIFENFTKEETKKLRTLIIELVLATDMAFHFSNLAILKERIASKDFDILEKDKILFLKNALHAADINTTTQDFSRGKHWGHVLYEEFFSQVMPYLTIIKGDKERALGLPISFGCDRTKVNLAKEQSGFISLFVQPLFQTISLTLPNMERALKNLEENKKKWDEIIPEYNLV